MPEDEHDLLTDSSIHATLTLPSVPKVLTTTVLGKHFITSDLLSPESDGSNDSRSASEICFDHDGTKPNIAMAQISALQHAWRCNLGTCLKPSLPLVGRSLHHKSGISAASSCPQYASSSCYHCFRLTASSQWKVKRQQHQARQTYLLSECVGSQSWQAHHEQEHEPEALMHCTKHNISYQVDLLAAFYQDPLPASLLKVCNSWDKALNNCADLA